MKHINTRRLFIVDGREPLGEGWTAFFLVVFLLVLSLAGCG